MVTAVTRALNRVKKYYRLYIQHDPFEITAKRWFRDHGDTTLRLNYPLSSDSIVFDVGAYRGDWSQAIMKRYHCNLFIFEPVPDFCQMLWSKFKDNLKAHVIMAGLYDHTGQQEITLGADRSSIFYEVSIQKIKIDVIDIAEFVAQNRISRIDLIKINIEGAEYRLLDRMIEQKVVQICTNIQVQFHLFYPNAVQLRDQIRAKLEKTHKLTYDYPFVWENWQKID
jgi:FkbM family methyltransferase